MPGPLGLLLAAALPLPAASPLPPPAPRRIVELAVAAGGSAAVALLKPDLRHALERDASLSNVWRNLAHPVAQVRRGTDRDTDPFWVNDVAHPGLFALEALWLVNRGRSDAGAFVFTQAHSLVWEFVIEGSAFEPSGHDLVMDAVGAAAAVWVLRPVAEGAARRVASGHGRAGDSVLRWLDPVARIHPGARFRVSPSLARGGFALSVSGTLPRATSSP